MDSYHVEPVKQVLPEVAPFHQPFQILVGGGYDPHIDLHRFMTTHAVELAIRQYPQQPGLQLRRHVTNLIQKECAAIRLFKTPFTAALCSSESTTFMTE